MVFAWFDSKEVVAFGNGLAEFLIQRIPLPDAKQGRERSEKKQKELLPKVFLQVDSFRASHRLNLYKKAKLGNAFKWKLLDAGYPSEFVDEFTKELMLRLR